MSLLSLNEQIMRRMRIPAGTFCAGKRRALRAKRLQLTRKFLYPVSQLLRADKIKLKAQDELELKTALVVAEVLGQGSALAPQDPA